MTKSTAARQAARVDLIVRKESANDVDAGLDFVLSDGTVDRLGDIIEPDGWVLTWFKKNPIALWGHDRDQPIGLWTNVRMEAKALRATLEFAAEGTSVFIDGLRRLLKQGIVRAVSVGFLPLEAEPIDENKPFDGIRFLRQELLEASLVSIPANPNALQEARSLDLPADVITRVFGKPAEKDASATQRPPGKPAEIPPIHRRTIMPGPLAKRIEDAQAGVVALKDQLTQHLENIDDNNPDDTATAKTKELNDKIRKAEEALAELKAAEQSLATTAEPAIESRAATTDSRRPFAAPAKKIQPRDYVFRAAVIALKAHVTKMPRLDVLQDTYGEDEATRVVFNAVTRAAAAPADTVTSGWASQLVNTAIGDFFDALMPQSAYPGLANRGGRFTFGRNGVISLPTRNTTPTIAGAFVGQGAPIPVKQGAFSAVNLTPKKMGVISTFTREIAEHSTPSIEALIRQAIEEDTSVAIDSVLLDINAATTIRPAGLRNGVTGLTATAGGGFAALVGDIKALTGALLTGTSGNLRAPVWIMNPAQVLSASLTQNAGGDFPFKVELAGGALQGYPVIQSVNVPAGVVILVDAADFFSATGDQPRFDVSDQAVLHMEDTAPLQIATGAQGAGVLATPARSLWQTDTIGVRMLLDINWALRRTGVVAFTSAVTW